MTKYPTFTSPLLIAALLAVAVADAELEVEVEVVVLLEVPPPVPLSFEPGTLLSSPGNTFSFRPVIASPETLYTACVTEVELTATSAPLGLGEMPLAIMLATPLGAAGMSKPSSKPADVISEGSHVGGVRAVAVPFAV